jgi:YfiH family protein
LTEISTGDAAVPRLELGEWATRYDVIAGITTRPLSLGLWSDEPVGQVIGRWRAFRTAFGARFPAMVLAHQVHGTDVHWHESVPDGWLILDGLDGHATRQRGVLLTVTVADCIPVYLTVPQTGAIALVHAGWRGTADGILEQCVALLKWRGAAKAGDIVMHCGVGICGACYEVGSEVAVRFGLSGTVLLDLRAILTQQARALGIDDITVSPWCSAEARDRFFSHRASRGGDGRMVAYLGRALG